MAFTEHSHRLFFALWPSDTARAAISEVIRPILAGTSARRIAPQDFHITLAFLGAVQARKLPHVMEAASRIRSAPFALIVDRLEMWPAARVLCLTTTVSLQLNALVDRLRFNLLDEQLQPDQKEFCPHVTIAREWGSRVEARPIEPVAWAAHEFVLVESEGTREVSRYRIIGRWPVATGERE